MKKRTITNKLDSQHVDLNLKISVSGPRGSGKTTMVAKLYDLLELLGYAPVIVQSNSSLMDRRLQEMDVTSCPAPISQHGKKPIFLEDKN